ncbi:hypothetical protein SLS58_006526 [Diplodia intermedia]|uniref:Uncharacterized protein n=1 Tax=Diplodia intermedia TaxID=856260 RepID=A0ABR3TND4_9PEZI
MAEHASSSSGDNPVNTEDMPRVPARCHVPRKRRPFPYKFYVQRGALRIYIAQLDVLLNVADRQPRLRSLASFVRGLTYYNQPVDYLDITHTLVISSIEALYRSCSKDHPEIFDKPDWGDGLTWDIEKTTTPLWSDPYRYGRPSCKMLKLGEAWKPDGLIPELVQPRADEVHIVDREWFYRNKKNYDPTI